MGGRHLGWLSTIKSGKIHPAPQKTIMGSIFDTNMHGICGIHYFLNGTRREPNYSPKEQNIKSNQIDLPR